jgi:hypothetical protein
MANSTPALSSGAYAKDYIRTSDKASRMKIWVFSLP